MRNYIYECPSDNAIKGRPDAPRVVKTMQEPEEARTSVSTRHPLNDECGAQS